MARKAAKKKATIKKKATKKKATKRAAKKAGKRSAGSTGSPKTKTTPSAFSLCDEKVEEILLAPDERSWRDEDGESYHQLLIDYFGEQDYRELRGLAAKARQVRARRDHRVLILPGIMGSKLGLERKLLFDDVLWLDPVDIALGKLKKLNLKTGDAKVQSVGVFLFAYLKLKFSLRAAGFDARFFHFDWRLSLDELGLGLVAEMEKLWDEGVEELSLVAHSMGGLVSRMAAGMIQSKSKSKLNDMLHQVVMLGTPNFGSFAPLVAYHGQNRAINKIAWLAGTDGTNFMKSVGSSFPGLFQMMPFPERWNSKDFYRVNGAWDIVPATPEAAIINGARAVQKKLYEGDSRFTMIVGVNQETVTNTHEVDGKYKFFVTDNGDGTVPVKFAVLPGAKNYYVESEHGGMPNSPRIRQAVVELLRNRPPQKLMESFTASVAPEREIDLAQAAPDDEKAVTSRFVENFDSRDARNLLEGFVSPEVSELESVGSAEPSAVVVSPSEISTEPVRVSRARQYRLDLSVAKGSITEIDTRAIVIGAFKNVTATGAARAIDKALGGAITEIMQRRMFNANAGEIFVFPAARRMLAAETVVIVGLGEMDRFDEDALKLACEQVVRAMVSAQIDEFGTVLIGAGMGRSIRATLKTMVEGYLRGIADFLGTNRSNRIRAITICELDNQRFEELYASALALTMTSLLDDLEITVERRALPQPRVLDAVRIRKSGLAADPVYLYVERRTLPESPDQLFHMSVLSAGGNATVLVGDAVVTKDQLDAFEKQVHPFVDPDTTPSPTKLGALGQDLVKLTMPESIERALAASLFGPDQASSRHLVVIHDVASSRLPWEAMQIGTGGLDSQSPSPDRRPAVVSGISRRFAIDLPVAKWLERRRRDKVFRILLAYNPTDDLSGTVEEAEQIIALGTPLQVEIKTLREEEATKDTILAELQSGCYDVFHFAGHAFFDPNDRTRSGLLCHRREVLRGDDIAALEALPSLVVFNACESGRVRGGKATPTDPKTRADTNIGIAEALLRGGIANFLGTYWPVSDAGAAAFAATFYQNLFDGKAIGTAVVAGRNSLLKPDGGGKENIDWADYIHYGDVAFQVKLLEEEES